MGYELNRLMQQYGLNSPTMGQYSGDPANTAEKAAYDKYRADYQGRLNITPQYQQAQFQTRQPDMNYLQTNPDVGAAYQSSGSALSPEGFARQHYLNYGQFEGRAMPALAGGQYWGNTLQAPQVTPYKAPDTVPIQYESDPAGFSYGKNTELNKSLVGAIPRLRELMPAGFGTGAFHTAYSQLKPQEKTLADAILARGYADGGYVDAQEQPGLQDQLLQRYADIDALRQKYITDTQSQLAQAQEQLNNPDQSEKWFRLAAAFASPTRSGTFGETLGNAAEALAANAAMQKENRNKAMDLAIKGNQIGLEGAEMGLQSLQDRYKIEKDMQTRQMLQDAYINADPARLAQIGVATNNPVAIQAANFYAGRQDAYNKPQEVYDEKGNAVLLPIGEVLGMPNPGGGIGGNREPQQPRAQIGQGSGYSYAKPTVETVAKQTRMAEDAKKESERQAKFLEDLDTKLASHTSQAKAGEQILGLTQPTGLAAPGSGASIKLGAAKALAAVTDPVLGIPLGKEWSDLEVADKKSKELAFRQRENFQKDPNMSQMDLRLYTLLPPGIETSYAGNQMLVEMSKLQAQKTNLIKSKASDWIAKYGSLDARKKDPRSGRMINFYDLKDEIASQSAFAPLFDKMRELGVPVDEVGQ